MLISRRYLYFSFSVNCCICSIAVVYWQFHDGWLRGCLIVMYSRLDAPAVQSMLHVYVVNPLKSSVIYGFYPRDAMLARVIEIATCLSVCPSVRHAPVLCQNEES